jgi:hypothetical protein
MFQLEPFSQSHLLRAETDPDLRGGVCVALCDYWLADIKWRPDDPPRLRLYRLASHYMLIAQYQKQYGQHRQQVGPQDARRVMGQHLGHDFEQHTTILPALIGTNAVRQRLAADLRHIGVGATWTMRFAPGGGHAIAGFYGMESLAENMHRARISIFDPNIGEYVGELRDLDFILNDLLNHFPLYQTVIEIRRTTDR